MKTNAKEYLKEFATSQQDWLQALIYDAIETNGNITDERKNKIFKHLINGADLSVTEPNISNETSESEIYITKLVHKSGIQALKEEQTIKFTKDITILYGLNGAGKSSYFKVLNEIVGGNQQKEILPNIYTETPKPIEIELVFKKNEGENEILNWNGSTRSLDLLNKCKVFDTSYLNGLLETRKADTTLIQPLSLNLFSYLVTLMDEFKQQLTSTANEKKLEKPILELNYLNDEIKEYFKDHLISNSIKSQIEEFYTFSDEDSKKLSMTETKLSTLRQINIQDKIRLKNIDKTDIDAIMAYIKSTHKKLSDFYLDAQTQLKLLDKNKNASELAKKQFEILSTIPNNDNPEWKKFIRSGEKYKSKVNDSDKICIYCRQSLQDENATKLIKSYAEFLKDASEQKLNNSLEEIENLKNKVEALSVELTIKEGIQKILQGNRLKENEVTFHETIVKANANFSVEKEELLNKVKEEDQTLKNNLFDM
jgi:energy-coupling factor transporter ATP-binding protein EcfA2